MVGHHVLYSASSRVTSCLMPGGHDNRPALLCRSRNGHMVSQFAEQRSLNSRRSAMHAVKQTEKEKAPQDDDDDVILAEVELKARRNRKRQKLPQTASIANKPKTLETEAVAGSQTETTVLQSLALGFTLILLQGVLLAASGFLPVAADNFIVDYIYPSFSYQLGFFFTCSTAYGLWKTSATK